MCTRPEPAILASEGGGGYMTAKAANHRRMLTRDGDKVAAERLEDFMDREGLPASFRQTMEHVCEPLAQRAARLRQVRRRTIVMGLCGPQASGKSTIAEVTKRLLAERRINAVVLSLDDFYLTHDARLRLAKTIHPLLAVRGPPGTHDTALAGTVIDSLKAKGRVTLPRFDKATDNRVPRGQWETVAGPVDVILFEGWCVGAAAQGLASLSEPLNDLERDEDPGGVWRGYVNEQLNGPYQKLFERLHDLVLLQPPGFEVVVGWRQEQERKLRERTGRGMSDAEVARFVQHYERITRAILTEMPARANWIVPLAADRTPFPYA